MSNLTAHREALLTVDSKRNIALFIDRIIMLKGEGNYTVFHLREGKSRMYAHCLHTYEEILQAVNFLNTLIGAIAAIILASVWTAFFA